MIISKLLRQSAGQRFQPKYQVCSETQCWLWIASTNKRRGGYGRFNLDGHGPIGAHKASWLLNVGEVPDGMHVLHACDVPSCVNPQHLFLGTNAENVADMDAKGRRVNCPKKGMDNARAKLSDEQVRQIYAGNGLQDEAAALYGVSRSLIGLIRQGKVWTHVTGGSP